MQSGTWRNPFANLPKEPLTDLTTGVTRARPQVAVRRSRIRPSEERRRDRMMTITFSSASLLARLRALAERWSGARFSSSNNATTGSVLRPRKTRVRPSEKRRRARAFTFTFSDPELPKRLRTQAARLQLRVAGGPNVSAVVERLLVQVLPDAERGQIAPPPNALSPSGTPSLSAVLEHLLRIALEG